MRKVFLIPAFLLFIHFSNLFAKDPGDKVDNFSIKNFDGKTYSINDVKDSKGLIIIFWSTKCPFVQAYNDRINDLVSSYQQKGFIFWAINSNKTESASEVDSHAKTNNYVFPVLKDENNTVADMFGATRTPEVFIINKDNVIVYHGRIDDNKDKADVTSNDLANALDEILGGKDVSIKSTKQFGCTIKR